MGKQNIHTGLALVLVWAVSLAVVATIIVKIDETDFAYLYADEAGAQAAGAAIR